MTGTWMGYASEDEYTKEWKRWRKQVKRCERLMYTLRAAFGLPPVRVRMPGGWAVEWEDAGVQRDEYTRDLTPKASQGITQTPAQVFGARALVRHECDAAIEEALALATDDLARLACVDIRIQMSQREAAMDDINLLTCADMMDRPLPPSREVEAPLNWYALKQGIAWASTNYVLEDDGTITCWINGKPATSIPPRSDKQVKFTTMHGWDVPAFRKRGHGEDWKCRHREDAITAAMRTVLRGEVPPARLKRGRPKVEWIVFAELGTRGVRACAGWAGLLSDEDIAHALDTTHADDVHVLAGI